MEWEISKLYPVKSTSKFRFSKIHIRFIDKNTLLFLVLVPTDNNFYNWLIHDVYETN